MLGVKLLHIFLISAAVVAGILLQPAFTGFFAFTVGSSSRLEVWDSAEPQGGAQGAFINEPVTFFANFTNVTSSGPVNGSGVFCEITFNVSGYWSGPVNMTYDEPSALYRYNRTFGLPGNYSWNVSCDGSALGHDALNVTDGDGIKVRRYEWWNNTWNYRIKIAVDNGDYNLTNWPVERDVNFTDILRQFGASGTFDYNSTRLLEYNATGGVMHELPSQFDNCTDYDASGNAAGTVAFIMNGTTEGNTGRVFYLYFDILENGAKEYVNYPTNLTYAWSGDEIHVNNSRLRFFIDTNRSENTSGLYEVYSGGTPPFVFLNTEDMITAEYMQYSNGTHNFSFDLRESVSIIPGPVRITIVQTGDEIYWGNTSQQTGEGAAEKRYYIYNHAGPGVTGTFIKIEQNFTNTGGYSITRNSTEAGALRFDLNASWSSYNGYIVASDGNITDPYSWYYGVSNFGDLVGVVNLEETEAGFFATNDTGGKMVGIQLGSTVIDPGESITEKAVAYFGKGTGQTDEFLGIKDSLRSPPAITESFERRTLNSYTRTDHGNYNRNETVIMTVNVTYDPYSLLQYVNITLDNGTASPADDMNMTMYDDGTHLDENASDGVYTNYYFIPTDSNTGEWTALAWMFDADMLVLNQSQYKFNITTELFVNTTIHNPTGLATRIVNATVDIMNYRQDVWHPGANLSCAVFSGITKIKQLDQDNITDYGNGSYFVTFKSPSYYGLFVLNCSANMTGNDGYGTDEFATEALETNLSIVITPENFTAGNVTWLDNQSFLVRVNATNTENGTAYNASINLGLPVNLTSNSTSAWCGVILISKSCAFDFNITVLKTTAPSNFSVNINVTWNNSDMVFDFNETTLNVTVEPTRILDVLEDNVTSVVAAGQAKNIENITLRSLGNAELVNVTLNVTGFDAGFNFTFMPVNMSYMAPGNTTEVRLYLEVAGGHPSGEFVGTLNVTSGNDGYEEVPVNITVSGTNMSIDVYPTNFTAANITYLLEQNFTIHVNTTNTDNATAYRANITLNFSSPYISTTNTTNYECGNKASSEYCDGSFIIFVSNGTPSGNYTVNVSVVWDNPEIGARSNSTPVNITVLSNVNLTIPEDDLTGNVTHGTVGILANFTMISSGNDPVEGVEFVVEDPAQQLKDFTIVVIPNITETSGGNLTAGAVLVVNVSVTVPLSYPPGIYGGYLNVTTNNSGYKSLSLAIEVPASRTWFVEDPADLYCVHAESPAYDILCNVTINNTGNVNITFNITPQTSPLPADMNNYTWTEVVDFEVGNQTTFQFSVFYNVTGANITQYNASYNLSAMYASPSSLNLTMVLTPFVNPIVGAYVIPGNIPQLGNLEIRANVTSQSGIPMNFTYANVTRPDNTTDSINMRLFGAIDNTYYYLIGYPTDSVNGTWGDSTLRGNYTITVYAEDDLGLNESANGSFYAYAVLIVSLQTSRSSGEYYQGETGTLSYKVTDASGLDLAGVNVSISAFDPTNRTLGLSNADFITNINGEPDAYPSFSLFSDSPTGRYNMTAASVFNDTPIGYIVTNTTWSNFTVVESKPGMLTMDLHAPATTSTTDGLEVMATVTDGIANVDADSASVSLFDPLGNPILTDQPMTHESTGRYSRWYNTSVSSNQGNWRWEVTITKDANVITKDIYTRLVGGPFDVRDINVIDNTVPGLSISVVVENTGEVSQDVFLEWNLTRTDNGVSLDSGLDTFMVDGNSERTWTIGPSTSYVGEVRITFLAYYAGTERAGAYEVFNTTTAPPGPGPGPEPGPEGPEGPVGPPVGPPPQPSLEITAYPEEISTEVGWTQYPSVTINNTGTTVLHNIRVSIDGVPSTWYTVEPAMLPLLNPGISKTFVLNLLVPEGTEAKQYYGTFNATANETYDEKLTSIIVFGSREELVRYQLKKLKEEFQDFKEDVNATAKPGLLDLSRVYDIIDEIQHQIDMTEGYLDAKMFDEALDSVTTGWRLLDRGRDLLKTAPLLRPAAMFMIPDWLIMLIMVMVIAILVLLLVLSKYRKRVERIFRREVPEAGAAKEMIGAGPAVSEAYAAEDAAAAARREEEREKIEKVLNLLEKEFKEGIISEKAYNELRKRNLEKLRELEG